MLRARGLFLLFIFVSLTACKTVASNNSSNNEEKIVLEAKQAYRQADFINARLYAPSEFLEASKALEQLNALNDDQITEKIRLAKQLKKLASRAFDQSKASFKLARTSEIKMILERLEVKNVKILAPAEYEKIKMQVASINSALEAEQFEEVQYNYVIVRQNILFLIRDIDENSYTIEQQKQLIGHILNHSTNFLTNNDRQNYSKQLFSLNQQAKSKSLEANFLVYQQLIFELQIAQMQNEQLKQLKFVDKKIEEVGAKIEHVSQYYLAKDDGALEPIAAWSAQKYLAVNPLIPLNSDLLSALDGELLMFKNYVIVPLLTTSVRNDTIVAGQEYQYNLYYQAIDFWKQAIFSRNDLKLEEAVYYLSEAEKSLRVFMENSVTSSYTVILNDNLWKIAEKLVVYNNRYLWPLIWQYNQRLIANPDLIYPQQKLLIPPLIE